MNKAINAFQKDAEAYRQYVLAELRCVRLRASRDKMMAAVEFDLLIEEIDRIGIALKSGVVDTDTAMAWLRDVGGLDCLMPTPPNKQSETSEVSESTRP